MSELSSRGMRRECRTESIPQRTERTERAKLIQSIRHQRPQSLFADHDGGSNTLKYHVCACVCVPSVAVKSVVCYPLCLLVTSCPAFDQSDYANESRMADPGSKIKCKCCAICSYYKCMYNVYMINVINIVREKEEEKEQSETKKKGDEKKKHK